MRPTILIAAMLVVTSASWGQTAKSSTPTSVSASSLTGSSLTSSSSLRGGGSFRPAPAAKGRSTVPGRTLDLYSKMGQARVYVMSAAAVSPVVVNPTRAARVAAIRAGIAAEQLANSQMAAMGDRLVGGGGVPSAVSHSVVPGFRPVVPSAEFDARSAGIRSAWETTAAQRLGIEGLEVLRQGDKVILRGRAASEDEARVAVRLLQLEPGINEVDNQIQIGTPTPPEPEPGN